MQYRLAGLVEVTCPACGYVLEVDLADVRAQISRYCPVCKTRLDLRDGDGSVYGAEREIERALGSVVESLGGYDMTIEI